MLLRVRASPVSVDFVDRIYVEVSDYDSATRLIGRLSRTRTAALIGEPACLVLAAFSSQAPDLANLLREIESWVDEESLCAIRFLLDGRIYVLEAGEPNWAAHPWQAEAA
jgi:hypothetical protein